MSCETTVRCRLTRLSNSSLMRPSRWQVCPELSAASQARYTSTTSPNLAGVPNDHISEPQQIYIELLEKCMHLHKQTLTITFL